MMKASDIFSVTESPVKDSYVCQTCGSEFSRMELIQYVRANQFPYEMDATICPDCDRAARHKTNVALMKQREMMKSGRLSRPQ